MVRFLLLKLLLLLLLSMPAAAVAAAATAAALTMPANPFLSSAGAADRVRALSVWRTDASAGIGQAQQWASKQEGPVLTWSGHACFSCRKQGALL
jgi:hypothetical protein